jgi:hypothetical protein
MGYYPAFACLCAAQHFFAEKLQFELVNMVTDRRSAGRTREDI